MAVKFAEVVEKMVVNWVLGEATETTTTVTGAQARAAAKLASSTASDAGTIASILKSIGASAAETFGGIFGFLSPVLGPAAAGEAKVLAVGAGIANFDVGSWSLPSDMIAQVHQGEMIVPSGPASAMRDALSGGQGGGNTVHVHVNHSINVSAIDTQGVKQFFKDHGKTALRAYNDSVRTGAHLGLSHLGTM